MQINVKIELMEGAVSQIKNKLDIVEFIGSYIPLKKAGRNFKAVCPFHKEKTPSFVISPERQIWHCFGACGDGGDIFKFLMKWENITFVEAVKELAQKTGVTLKNASFEDREWKKKERLFSLNTLALEYYQYVLTKTSIGKKAKDYLLSRGLKEGTIAKFEIGYAPSSWDSLYKFLKKRSFTEDEIIASGLLIKGDRGSYYDRFRGRIMFPIKDARNNVIGFSGRVLDPQAKEAKYVNTPETLIYHKRESLFGIQIAREYIKKEENVLLVEGEFDMISLYQNDYAYAVAAKGTAVTREQLTILKRLTPKMTLCLDADEAGVEAMKRVAHEAEDLEFDIYVLDLEDAKDPAEALQKNPANFKKKMKTPESIYDFIIKKTTNKYDVATAFGKKKIGAEVIPFVSHIQNPIVQSHYLNKLAQLLDVSVENIQDLVKKQVKRMTPSSMATAQIQTSPLKRQELLEKYLLASVFQYENTYEISDAIFTHLEPDDFSFPAYKKIVQAFLSYKFAHPQEMNSTAFCEALPAELQPACNELYLFTPADLSLEKEAIVRIALEIKRYSLKKKISVLIQGEENNREKELSLFSTRLKEVEKLLTGDYNYKL